MNNEPFIETEFAYDEEQHYAPPIRIQWITRTANRTTETKWIFIQCCGQIGRRRKEEDSLITSRHPCKNVFSSSIKSTECHHPGDLILQRTTHSQVVKHKPPLAEWDCCDAQLPPWNESWQSSRGMIPFHLVNTGCVEGRYKTRPFGPSNGDGNIAKRAKPIGQKSKASKTSASKSSGPSSGEQTVVLAESKLINPEDIKFTQKTVWKTFSDSSKPPLLEAMQLIFDGNLDVTDFKRIRVAMSKDMQGHFYSCDNRRLFLFKSLRLKEIDVQWIDWTSEFDSKLNQNTKKENEIPLNTDEEGIDAFRKVFIKSCFEHSIDNGEDSNLYIPRECAGYLIGSKGRTIRNLRGRFATHIIVSQLSTNDPGGSLVDDIVQVSYSENVKSKRRYVPGKAKRAHAKMIHKLLRKRNR